MARQEARVSANSARPMKTTKESVSPVELFTQLLL
jgi:hypothetical protein